MDDITNKSLGGKTRTPLSITIRYLGAFWKVSIGHTLPPFLSLPVGAGSSEIRSRLRLFAHKSLLVAFREILENPVHKPPTMGFF